MGRLRAGVVCLVVLAGLGVQGAEPAPPDFKLRLGLYGTAANPIETGELVFRKGIAYQFLGAMKHEVQIVDLARSRIVLLDLKRRIETEITPAALDIHLVRLRRSLDKVVETKQKSEDRSDRVAGAMGKDLADPKFRVAFDEKARRLEMVNPTVEITATGEADLDPSRLALTSGVLSTLVKLGSLREPTELPPYSKLLGLQELSEKHKLRPTELSMLVRLTGPPKRVRWTYQLVPQLTDREREAITRVERLRVECQFVPFQKYEDR